jgi:ubiquinone/menaquinone biosynthesis C-methylase UbiE
MYEYNYEESVRWMRAQSNNEALVKDCYLDEDNVTAAKRFAASEEFAEALEILGLVDSKSAKVLDLGCGNGIASYAFASYGHQVSAVDPDPSGDVGLAAVKNVSEILSTGSITTFQSFAESLPFAENTFDVIYARQCLHHFSNLVQALKECRRVLKPGGLFLACREHVVSDDQQKKVFLEEHILHKLHGGENAYPVQTYISAIEEAGFQMQKLYAPFDTVINHFPASNAEIQRWFSEALSRKIGNSLASLLVNVKFAENGFRKRLSESCDAPGRLYSFLATK